MVFFAMKGEGSHCTFAMPYPFAPNNKICLNQLIQFKLKTKDRSEVKDMYISSSITCSSVSSPSASSITSSSNCFSGILHSKNIGKFHETEKMMIKPSLTANTHFVVCAIPGCAIHTS